MNTPAPADTSKPATEPAATRSLADQVYEAVKHMVFSFELLPGTRFSESDLTKKLQVSRTPLRQALHRLEAQGLLQVLPKMGWYVAPIDFDVMDELYDLRILIETHAVERLVGQTEQVGLQSLAQVWLAPEPQRELDGAAVGQLDEAFHTTLVTLAGNREMARVHQDVTDRIRLIRRLDFTKPTRVQATYAEHGAILKAILAHRKDEAVRLVRAHIAQSKLEVRKITLDALHQARYSAPLTPWRAGTP